MSENETTTTSSTPTTTVPAPETTTAQGDGDAGVTNDEAQQLVDSGAATPGPDVPEGEPV